MKIVECKTNHLTNPLGYKMDSPVFSYVVVEAKGKYQTNARIRISFMKNMDNPFFDTGLVYDIDSLAYRANILLEPRTRYYWTVYIQSEIGEEAESEINWFETGKCEEKWNAKWITCDSEKERHPIFFKDLPSGKDVQNARLYICGLGLYEVSINDEKVSNEFLAPYCNNYDQWLQYQTYDVTKQMENGGRLEVILGNGWYKGRFYNGNPIQESFYGTTWKLIAEIRIVYHDGREVVISTDESWQVRPGRIKASSIYDGEIMDATLKKGVSYQAILCEEPSAVLTERLSTPVTVQEEITPVSLILTPAGETVLDLGQNIAGIFRLNVKEPLGKVIHLQFGEILQNGNFYRDNMRSAKAEYIFISEGKEHVLEPHFTYYGYRYVKVEGIENLKKEDFTGLVLFSDLPRAGKLSTGHNLVNQLIQNTQWSQKGNFIDVPTDCPQRDERLGWTGDAQVFSPTSCYLRDSYAFFRKYLYDMASEQEAKGGLVPAVIPSFGMVKCSSAWGDAACIIPWNLYLFYGDESILRERFDSMKAWVDYVTKVDGEDHGWRKDYHFGDWLALDNPIREDDHGGTDPGFIASVYYAHSAGIVAKTARVLGKNEDAKSYEKLAEKIMQGVRDEYFSKTGRLCLNTQTALLMALHFGVTQTPEKTREALKQKFKESKGKLQTGFVGTPILCSQLTEEGMEELAYQLLLNEDYPGWLYEVKLGATTIWERWDSVLPDGSISSTGMNSLNHYASGSIVEWLYRYAAGINPVEEFPGFRKVRLSPNPSYSLKYLNAECNTAAGLYKSAWEVLDDNHLKIQVSVPFGCEADLILPYASDCVYKDLDNPIFSNVSNGICHLDAGGYTVVYETTKALRKVLSTDSPICEILENSSAKEYFAINFPQFIHLPVALKELSPRQIAAQYGNGEPDGYEGLDEFLASCRS